MRTHNSATDRKVELRQQLAARMDGPLRVLEFYAGPGKMRDACWSGVERWDGIDQDIDSVATYLGDAAAIARHLDLTRYNVFDADAFSMPWEVLWRTSRRAAAEPLLVFGTAGDPGMLWRLARTFRAAGWSRQMLDALGAQPEDWPYPVCAGKTQAPRAIRAMMAAWFDRWDIRRFSTTNGGGSGGTLYFGMHLTPRTGSPDV